MTQPPTELTRLQRAVLAMKEMSRRIEVLEGARAEPIAVIGMACRFPGGGDTPEAFWRLLLDGVDAVTEVPAERWDIDAYYHPDPDHSGTMTTRSGSFLPDVDRFDPHFFGMSEHEATSIDPQHRLLLEVAWEALERAGIPPSTLEESRTGVYVGITAMEYIHILHRAGAVNAYYVGGAPLCAAAGRLSHLLGLQGPCMSIDTACSSALVSIHQACQSLRDGESELALAGGVNLTLTPHGTVFLSRAHMLASSGRCKTFSADADGFVRGEGCGVLVLRRLGDALAAGDPIQGVILGSAVNHDGPSNGFTAPNGRSQERLIRRAMENARVEPEEVALVETHGTGTPLGDPIEVEAIGRALCSGRATDNPLFLGAVKTNLGHLESAAGAAGMIKALLSVNEGRVPGNLHFGEPNPYISWDRLPVKVPGAPTDWPGGRGRRVAGVSAFGATGTNAHIVIAQPPDPATPGEEDVGASEGTHDRLLALSARNAEALRELASRYAEHMASHSDESFADVCYTAATGRDHFEHRLALVAGSGTEAAESLAAFARGDEAPGLVVGEVRGPHPPGAGLAMAGEAPTAESLSDLLAIPAFREAYESCGEDLEPSAALLRGMAHLYAAGVPLEVGAAKGAPPRQKVVLPTYPFQRVRCWPEVLPFSASTPDLAPDPPVITTSQGPSPATLGRVSLGSWSLLMLASPTGEGLEREALRLAEELKDDPGRAHRMGRPRPGEMEGQHRRVVVFEEPEELRAILAGEKAADRRTASGVADRESLSIAFMLPGLGDHYPGMARGLYEQSSGFRRRLDRCATLLEPELEQDLREVLFAERGDQDAPASPAMDMRTMLGRSPASDGDQDDPLNRISLAHTSIFSVEYALAGVWGDWGVSPGAFLGFSLGEIVGATLAGVMSLREGLTLVARRARAIETLPRGAMLAVPLSVEDLGEHLDGGLSLAVQCAPRIQVVGGASEEIAGLEARLADRDIVSRRLQSDYAFHTGAMAGQERTVRDLVAGFDLHPPTIPLCSNTSGGWMEPDEATDPGYWARHTMLPVRFGEGVDRLLETDHQLVLEVGPGQSLTSFALQSPSMASVSAVQFIPSLRSRHEADPDVAFLLRSLGRAWISGIEISPPEEEA